MRLTYIDEKADDRTVNMTPRSEQTTTLSTCYNLRRVWFTSFSPTMDNELPCLWWIQEKIDNSCTLSNMFKLRHSSFWVVWSDQQVHLSAYLTMTLKSCIGCKSTIWWWQQHLCAVWGRSNFVHGKEYTTLGDNMSIGTNDDLKMDVPMRSS